MHDIRHRVGIKSPIDEAYQAVATREGLASWWTEDVRGESREGGKLEFHFGGPGAAAVMEVVELEPPTRVRWRCVEGPEEWQDTTVTFELKPGAEETILLFTHAGWREPVEFMHHCSSRWAYFLFGLRAASADGAATPWPNDRPIDS